MKSPFLIQKANFADQPKSTGLDSIIRLEYMGSAEFEFGAIPKSLARIRGNISEYDYTQYAFENSGTKIVTIFCRKDEVEQTTDYIQGLAENMYHLQESCDLKYWVYPGTFKNYCDFYWDIENDFMFWKSSPEFDTKFKSVIK